MHVILNTAKRDNSRPMLTHYQPTTIKQTLYPDHDLTELTWLTRSDIFDRSSSNSKHRLPVVSQSLPTYIPNKDDIPRHRSSPGSLHDSSDGEHDNDSSSLNSSSERVTTNLTDLVSPPHSALCFWIFFALEDSRTHSLTLNAICDWIEHHIEQQLKPTNLLSSDEQLIRSARLKSKIRYHMTKQISFFVKISKDPLNGIKLRYPLWTTDRSKRSLLLDTLLTMNTRQLSLHTQYTIDIYQRLCSERRENLLRNINDENSCPKLLLNNIKRDKTIHRLGSCEESNSNNKRKKARSKIDSSSTIVTPSVEVVDAAMTLLLLRQTK